MRAFSIIILATVAMALVACTDELPLDDRPCPCADGWKCCANQDVCVPEGDPCPEGDTGSGSAEPNTDPEGLGDPCTALGQGHGCEGKEASFCSYMGPLAEGQCSVTCNDYEGHSDCPAGWYCCDFQPMVSDSFCMPAEYWAMIPSEATCSNWQKDEGVPHGGQ